MDNLMPTTFTRSGATTAQIETPPSPSRIVSPPPPPPFPAPPSDPGDGMLDSLRAEIAVTNERITDLHETDMRQAAVDADHVRRIVAIEERPITGSQFLAKLYSRKLWITVLATVGAVVAGLTNVLPAEWAGAIATVSTVVYVLSQALVDRKAAEGTARVAEAKVFAAGEVVAAAARGGDTGARAGRFRAY